MSHMKNESSQTFKVRGVGGEFIVSAIAYGPGNYQDLRRTCLTDKLHPLDISETVSLVRTIKSFGRKPVLVKKLQKLIDDYPILTSTRATTDYLKFVRGRAEGLTYAEIRGSSELESVGGKGFAESLAELSNRYSQDMTFELPLKAGDHNRDKLIYVDTNFGQGLSLGLFSADKFEGILFGRHFQ